MLAFYQKTLYFVGFGSLTKEIYLDLKILKFCYAVAVILLKLTLFLNEGVIKCVLLQKQFEKTRKSP